jgi:hypothetical protein
MLPPRATLLALASLLAATTAAPLAAQTDPPRPSPASVRAAVATITETDFRQRLSVLADDSMRGRATPSPELDETAAYVAAAFRHFGLAPGGDSGSFIQRYPVRRIAPDSDDALVATGPGVESRWGLGSSFLVAEGQLPEGLTNAPAVLMVGLAGDSVHPFGDVDVRGAVVFQMLPLAAQREQARLLRTVAQGAAAGARAWVFLFNVPQAYFAARARDALAPRYEVPGLRGLIPVPLLLMRDSSAADVLRAAGEDLLALRDTSLHAVRPLRGVTVSRTGRDVVALETTAPNVVGILEGGDPRLADEYVLVTGHMDHVGVTGGGQGCVARGADSICNGADDDGSGTVGVVQLAQAFARLTPHPARTMIFVTVSGEERGLWGSAWFADHPARPLAQAAADLQMDMIGRNSRDSIAVVGMEHSTLRGFVLRADSAHPELGMRLVDDPEHGRYYMQSDHYSFARKGVPSAFLFNGIHAELHQPTDELRLIDAEKAARIVRMAFYVLLDIANAAERPQWDPAARARIVDGAR